RNKERKARTRRLIQEGAILEKALPHTTQMTLEQLEDYLCSFARQN
ncbi:MAG: conjugal transfer protein TraD, partial [Oscillospiraceae bacterium]|nr:conjugal transfer protein TraD [Oscillospiraceae bacterium]